MPNIPVRIEEKTRSNQLKIDFPQIDPTRVEAE
jgi:hypothetical protein